MASWRLRVVGVWAALMMWSVVSCERGSDERGVMYRGERIAVVDMHLHTGEWDAIPEQTRRILGTRFPFPFSLNPEETAESALDPDGVLEEMDKAGVGVGVIFAVYAPRSVGVASNEFVLGQLAADEERFYGLASLRVDDWQREREAQLQVLDEALSRPRMIGVKLAHAHQHFRFDDPAYYDIYKVAAKHSAPVYLHTGPSPFEGTATAPEYTDPRYLEEAIAQHPDTIFILGHLGYDFINKRLGYFESCIDLATRYPNVYLEPSALGSRGSDPEQENLAAMMRRIKEAGLVERTIYGSDGPQSPGFLKSYLERTVVAMERSDYSAQEARAVLHGNFERVFGLTLSERVKLGELKASGVK